MNQLNVPLRVGVLLIYYLLLQTLQPWQGMSSLTHPSTIYLAKPKRYRSLTYVLSMEDLTGKGAGVNLP